MRTTFERLQLRATKRVACAAGCGRKVGRQKTFWMTLNPWNQNADGTTRTREEVYGRLHEEAEAWRLLPEWCREDAA